ncbi:hypothetical protein H4582DRAFT_1005934 [Lactarius indigo]|nr:hypothetical protein H4582DRAFT_1005934 [Lactarius indigo]
MLPFLACSWCLPLFLQFTVQIMSLPTIRNLTVTGLGTGYHLILGISCYYLLRLFDFCPSCYPHLEACQFIMSLKHVT